MQCLTHDKIKKPLAQEILFGKLEDGGSVKVTENFQLLSRLFLII